MGRAPARSGATRAGKVHLSEGHRNAVDSIAATFKQLPNWVISKSAINC